MWYSTRMSHDSFCLFSRFCWSDTRTILRPENPVFWVEFRPNPSRGVCIVRVCSPDLSVVVDDLWNRVPVVRTLLLNGTAVGRGEREYRTDTLRVAWGMLARGGWSTTIRGAETAEPVMIYTDAELQRFTDAAGQMLQDVGNAQGQIW